MSRAPFIWIKEQPHDPSFNFRKLVSQGPSPRNDGENRWYLFRYQFELEHLPESALVDVTVDGRYQLFINQKRIQRGPIRCSPEFQRYDHLDIASHLKLGVNVVGMLVHVYGKDTAWYQKSLNYWQSIFGDGCVYFDGRLCIKNQEKKITTNTNWKYINADAWDRNTPASGWGQDYIEKFNANEFPSDWLCENFNDQHWNNCVELVHRTSENENKMGWHDIKPFPILKKNTLPPLTEKLVTANSILDTFRVEPNKNLEFSERLYQENFNKETSENLEIIGLNYLIDEQGETFLKTKANQDVAVILEFAQLETGYPYIELMAHGNEQIEIAVSETLPGEYTEKGITQNRLTINSHLDCKHLFCYQAKEGAQGFEKFEWTAIKYMVLVVRNADKGVTIKSIGVNATTYPLEFQGKFECSDPLLNQLWQVGSNTILKCSHDAWEDCPSREKRQWIGDGFVRYPASLVCFGNSSIELDRLYLQQAAESQRSDGLLQMFAPGDHHYHGIVIPDFSLHWISCLYQYLWFTNDLDSVEKHLPTLEKIINWFKTQLNSRNMLADVPHWHFIEWANVGRSGQATIINAMFAGALKQSAFIAETLGFKRASDKHQLLATQISENLNQSHWDPVRQVYVDYHTGSDSNELGEVNNDSRVLQVSQHANILMILHELAPSDRWQKMVDYITDERRVKFTATPPVVMEGAQIDPQKDVIKCNTSFSHFLYGALAKTDNFFTALNLIRKNYGAMLSTGTPTLWESFSPDASLCHAFSASPNYYLSKEILGVTPLAVGFSKVLISPTFCNLEFAQGQYPTIHGPISIRWQFDSNQLVLDLDIPKEIEATLDLDSNIVDLSAKIKLTAGKQELTFKRLPHH